MTDSVYSQPAGEKLGRWAGRLTDQVTPHTPHRVSPDHRLSAQPGHGAVRCIKRNIDLLSCMLNKFRICQGEDLQKNKRFHHHHHDVLFVSWLFSQLTLTPSQGPAEGQHSAMTDRRQVNIRQQLISSTRVFLNGQM